MVYDSNRRKLLKAGAAIAAAATLPVWAQTEKPITLVAAAPPGGSNDAVARMIAEAWSNLTQRTVVVDNKPGASGLIGFGYVAKGAPDGSLLALTSSAFAINPATTKKMPFDVLKDLSGVAGVAQSPLILVANAQLPVQSPRELRAFIQRDPSRVAFASADSAALLATTQLLTALGGKVPIVNYKGTGPAMTDVAGGHVALSVTTPAAALPFIRGGQAKAVGFLSSSRLKAMPDVPTFIEQGIDVEFQHWLAIHAPSQVPRAVIDKLGAELQRVVSTSSFESRLDSIYAAPLHLGPRELDAFVAQMVKRMGSLAAAAGLQPE